MKGEGGGDREDTRGEEEGGKWGKREGEGRRARRKRLRESEIKKGGREEREKTDKEEHLFSRSFLES